MKVITNNAPGANDAPAGPTIEDLARKAEKLDQTGDGTEAFTDASGDEDQRPKVTNATLIAGALEMAREGFCFATKLESPRKTFTTDQATQLGDLWGAVCDARGINLQEYMGAVTLELAAAAATFQIAQSVRAGVVAELAQRRAAAPPGKAAGDSGASGDLD
jgi:hypothetical protein